MLEKLVSGWGGKLFVLVLLGFAATDFVITKTLSAADAAEHLIHNPYWPSLSSFSEGTQRIAFTMLLLVLLGAMFMRGFREVIGVAAMIVGVYLLLNAIVIVGGLYYLVEHPDLLQSWYSAVLAGDWHVAHAPVQGEGWLVIVVVCVLLFPKLALGLSGFETGVAVMPLIQGRADDDPQRPRGRIRNTRKLLVTAAVVMSLYLLGSSIVVATLIPPSELITTGDIKPPAADRALAYLAHDLGPEKLGRPFGDLFGTAYDLSTIIILWFAGASAMAGLLNLVPQYLPRYGMAPEWASAVRPLVLLFTAINLVVTWIFDASVSAQGGAYATGVLVLMSSACVATVIARWRERTGSWFRRTPWTYVFITGVFLYTTTDVIIAKPEGIKIAAAFILAIVLSSIVSRARRSVELRFHGFRFQDPHSRFLWDSMRFLEIPVLVPHRPGRRDLTEKDKSIRAEHRLAGDIPIVFLEVQLGDASDFYQEPLVEVKQEGERFLLKVTRSASIAHVVAAIGLELARPGAPPEIHFGWSDESPWKATLRFLLFGEGNVPWLVRELIRKAEPDPERQPRVIIG